MTIQRFTFNKVNAFNWGTLATSMFYFWRHSPRKQAFLFPEKSLIFRNIDVSELLININLFNKFLNQIIFYNLIVLYHVELQASSYFG
jgi:hypothetical protein